MKRIIITRPEEDALELAITFRNMGIEPVIEPMLDIIALENYRPTLQEGLAKSPQAILITSKHALSSLNGLLFIDTIPILTVGDNTSQLARKSGRRTVITAGQNAEALVDYVTRNLTPKNGPLLYLRGEDISVDIAAKLQESGFSVNSCIVYSAKAKTTLSEPTQTLINNGNVNAVCLFSARTARIYESIIKDNGLQNHHKAINALCISEAVANTLTPDLWGSLEIAKQPDMTNMLNLVTPT